MKDYVKRMVEEHADLVIKIDKLHNYVYSERSDADNKPEFANKCIQLAAMKKYEEALRARLNNEGVFFEDGVYLERIGQIGVAQVEEEAPNTPADEAQNPE